MGQQVTTNNSCFLFRSVIQDQKVSKLRICYNCGQHVRIRRSVGFDADKLEKTTIQLIYFPNNEYISSLRFQGYNARSTKRELEIISKICSLSKRLNF